MTSCKMMAKANWDEATVVTVSCQSWGGDQPIQTKAAILCTAQDLWVKMICKEANPKVTYYGDNQPVYLDSCMECFFDFMPQADYGYLNLECNAGGALYAAFGRNRNQRTLLTEMQVPLPTAKITSTKDTWEVLFQIPQSLIAALYAGNILREGDVIAANFYKCGDETDTPHYLSWQPIEAEQPDFHRPESFGKLQICGETTNNQRVV